MECVFVAQALRAAFPPAAHVKPSGPFKVGDDTRSSVEQLIAVFYSTLDQSSKDLAHTHLQQGKCRVLVSSEAYGLGMDVDVDRVIQWGVAKVQSLDTIVQRFGRAARKPEVQGMCVLYVERSYFNDNAATGELEETQPPESQQTQPLESQQARGKRTRRTAAEMKTTKDPGIMAFINTPVDVGCRRRMLLQHYHDPLCDAETEDITTGPCCDVDSGMDISEYPCGVGWCNVIERSYENTPKYPTSSGWVKEQMEAKLSKFCSFIFKRDWEPHDDFDLFTEDIVLSDKQISTLARSCTKYPDTAALRQIRGFEWAHMDRYGDELCSFTQKMVVKLKAQETAAKAAAEKVVDAALAPAAAQSRTARSTTAGSTPARSTTSHSGRSVQPQAVSQSPSQWTPSETFPLYRSQPQHQALWTPSAQPQHQALWTPSAQPQHQAPWTPSAHPQHQPPPSETFPVYRPHPQHQAPPSETFPVYRPHPQHQAPPSETFPVYRPHPQNQPLPPSETFPVYRPHPQNQPLPPSETFPVYRSHPQHQCDGRGVF
jgi:hypothetical protein